VTAGGLLPLCGIRMAAPPARQCR